MMFRRLREILEDRLEVLDRRWVGRARARKASHPSPTTAHEVKILLTLAATLVLRELVLWAYARVMLEGWPVDYKERLTGLEVVLWKPPMAHIVHPVLWLFKRLVKDSLPHPRLLPAPPKVEHVRIPRTLKELNMTTLLGTLSLCLPGGLRILGPVPMLALPDHSQEERAVASGSASAAAVPMFRETEFPIPAGLPVWGTIRSVVRVVDPPEVHVEVALEEEDEETDRPSRFQELLHPDRLAVPAGHLSERHSWSSSSSLFKHKKKHSTGKLFMSVLTKAKTVVKKGSSRKQGHSF